MRLTLLNKLLLFILTPTLLGVGIVAGFSFYSAQNALDAQIIEEMTLVIGRQKSELDTVTAQLRSILHNATDVARIRIFLKEQGEGASPERLAELRPGAQKAVADLTENFPLVRQAGLISADGTVLAHTEESQIGTQRGDRNYFKASMQGRPSVETLHSKTLKTLTVIISAPIELDGKTAGVLFIDVNLETLSRASTDTIKMGNTGICYIYDGNGTMIAHPNKAYIGDEDAHEQWTSYMLANRNGRVAYDWNGKKKVAYFREIQGMDWILVLAVEREDMFRAINIMLRNNMLLVLLTVLAVGLTIFLVARNIASVLKGGAQFVEHVAEGNLELTPEMRQELAKANAREDEIGTLSRGVGYMVDNIRQLVEETRQKEQDARQATEEARKATAEAEEARHAAERARREGMLAAANQLEEVVNIISSASTELSAQIEQSGRGAEEQAARASETATAMEEMNSTVVEVARNAGDAAKVSEHTKQKAEEGADIVHKAVASIRQVQEQSLALKQDMTTLSDQTQSISQIMGVISDIADQTNLLALNAAIEAARAGEAGRGFAVVADEVRKLAEKTMASTTDVGNAIQAIQASSEQNARQVELAVQSIDEATELAGRSGAALEEIVGMADGTADQVRAIAAASEQQSAASEEINKSVTQVNTIAGETAKAMQEASRAISDLARQAQVLTSLIESMKQA